MQSRKRQNTGKIEVICGSMFSGKTEELIRRIRRAQIAKLKVQVFKPVIDQRYDRTRVTSHSAQSVDAEVVELAEEIPGLIHQDTQVVAIDEAQFFSMQLVSIAQNLADQGLRVLIAGLDQDYRGKPFEPVPQLLAIAEEVTKCHAICSVCGEAALRSQRLSNVKSNERVVVGAADSYEARCRGCYQDSDEIEQVSAA